MCANETQSERSEIERRFCGSITIIQRIMWGSSHSPVSLSSTLAAHALILSGMKRQCQKSVSMAGPNVTQSPQIITPEHRKLLQQKKPPDLSQGAYIDTGA